jgi:SET domain-containing protein
MRKRSIKSSGALTIEVRPSVVHGYGVFAVAPLPAGSLVGRYEGRRYSEAQALRRDWDDRLTYLFGLSDGSIIDGAEGGNATRHVNHACAPNCQAVEYCGRGGQLEVRIETLRAVRAGEELTLDYALQVDPDSEDEHACTCGSSNCRGSMLEAGRGAA